MASDGKVTIARRGDSLYLVEGDDKKCFIIDTDVPRRAGPFNVDAVLKTGGWVEYVTTQEIVDGLLAVKKQP